MGCGAIGFADAGNLFFNSRSCPLLIIFSHRQPEIPNAEHDKPHQTLGRTAWLEKIFSVARAGGGVFSSRLHFAQISGGGATDFRLRLRTREARRPAECPPRVLFRAGGGISLLCATSLLRSEEHTSELQSLRHLVCRLLL